MVIDWHAFPAISGLMVTTVPERHAFALESIKDFSAQRWPHKEMVVVNTTPLAFPKLEGVFEIPARNVPNLWEFGRTQCRGEWIADWQDDCRYSKLYLHAMARLRSRERRVTLSSYRGICVADGQVVNVDNDDATFSLIFRLAPNVTSVPNWLDKPEMATRYYAAKA